MSLGFKKERDVMEVFNDNYRANHNENFFRKEKERQDSFNARMFGTRSIPIPTNHKNTPHDLNNRVKSMNELQQQNNFNNFKNNLK